MAEPSTSPVLRHLRRLAAEPPGDALTDRQLLARFAAGGDGGAFAELVRRHGPMVLAVCRRVLGNEADAEDAFQATFLVLARKAAATRWEASAAGWLYEVARRVASDMRARARRRLAHEARATLAREEAAVAGADWGELQEALDGELGRLPKRYREPLLLCYWQGLTRDAAARRLGLPLRTLDRRLAQGRDRLRARLSRRGLGLPAALLAAGLPQRASAVPATLSAAACRAALAGGAPARVAALAGGALKSLPLSRLRAALLVSLVLAAGGLGWAALPAGPPAAPGVSAPGGAGPAETEPGPDGDGRPLPAGAVRRLGSRRFRVEGRSDFILPTPDGKYALVQPQPPLSANPAQGLMLLDLDTGLRVRSFEGGRRVPKRGSVDAVRPAAFSPDGKKLYALAWHKAEEGGQAFYVWANLNNPCRRVVLVWDVATGKRTAEWELPPGDRPRSSLLGAHVSPDGKRLYVYGAIRMATDELRNIRGVPGTHVLDAATGKHLQTWEGAGYPVGEVAGGKELITFRHGAPVTAHDAATGKPVRTFPLAGFVSSVVLSPDGRSVAAVSTVRPKDKPVACDVRLWEAATGREMLRLAPPVARVGTEGARLAFAADGKTLYLAGRSGRVLRWDVASGKELPGWAAHRGMVADLFPRPGTNELLSAGESDGIVRRWDAVSGRPAAGTGAYAGEIAVARSPDRKALAVADVTGRLDVWDVATGRVTRSLRLPADPRRALLFSPDGRALLDATEDGRITVRDAATGAAVREIPAPPRQPRESGGWCALAFSPDGKHLLASKYGYGTRVLSWPDGKVVWQRPESHVAAYASAGRLVAGRWGGRTQFLDAHSGVAAGDLPGDGLVAAAAAPDGLRLVTAHLPRRQRLVASHPEETWRVRAAPTGEVLKEVKAFRYPWSVAFSPTGWLLAVAGDNSVRVYDTATWAEVARLDGHEATVGAVFFGPDDATLVSASAEDGTALVWSLRPTADRALPEPERLWADLAGDGAAVRRAVWAAAAHPELAVKLFRQKWPPERPADAGRLRKLVAGLDGDTFEAREASEADLAKLGRRAEPVLRKALAETTSPEVKRRAARLLARWAAPAGAEYPAGQARELRAVWALELAGTPEAKKLLEEWAGAGAGERLCEAADGALKRLRRGAR